MALVCGIFRKVLRLSGLGNSHTGNIQNMMSNDAQMFLMLAPQAHQLWGAPIIIIACFVLLGLLVREALLSGLLVMFLGIPLQMKIGITLFKYRKEQLKLTDERVKVVNELVQGMRVVKMCAWEASVQARIDAIRKQELHLVWKTRLVSSAMSTMLLVQPVMITVAVFGTYSALGYPLSASVILPALSLLTLLRFPLAFFPMLVVQMVNLKVRTRSTSLRPPVTPRNLISRGD